MGSTTKAFTAAAMALVVNDNKNYPQVQWDTPVYELIPDTFALANSFATTHITIEDLLSHRTGLARHDLSYGRDQNATIKEIVESLRHLPLTAALRSKYQYCNLMYIVVAHIIETMTGRYLGDFLTEHIWRPLGMKWTFYSLKGASESMREDLACTPFTSAIRDLCWKISSPRVSAP